MRALGNKKDHSERSEVPLRGDLGDSCASALDESQTHFLKSPWLMWPDRSLPVELVGDGYVLWPGMDVDIAFTWAFRKIINVMFSLESALVTHSQPQAYVRRCEDQSD